MFDTYTAPADIAGPAEYAERLARYINCADSIEKAVRRTYGRAPEQRTISGMIEARKAKAKKAREVYGKPTAADAEHWRPRGICTPKVHKPRAVEAPTAIVDVTGAPVVAENLRPPLPRELIKLVAAHFNMTAAEVTGPARGRRYVHVRSLISMLLRQRGMSTPRIGYFLGGRDHSSIINCIAKFDIYCAANRSLRPAFPHFGGKK